MKKGHKSHIKGRDNKTVKNSNLLDKVIENTRKIFKDKKII